MASSTVTFTPSPLVKYIVLTFALIATVVLSYVAHVFPDWTALAGIVAYIPTVIYYIAHDLEATGTPDGVPYWTTFIVVNVAAGIEGAIGQFVLSNGTITLTAAIVWALAVLNYLFHVFNEDQGANAPKNAENWVTAALGIGIGLLSFYYANPTAGITAFLVTTYTVVTQYVHVSTDGNTISATPVTPAPAPS